MFPAARAPIPGARMPSAPVPAPAAKPVRPLPPLPLAPGIAHTLAETRAAAAQAKSLTEERVGALTTTPAVAGVAAAAKRALPPLPETV